MAHPYDVQGARAGTIVRRALIALGVALGLCLLLLATLPKEASAQDGSSPAASHVSPSATLELDFGDSQTFTASATDADGNLSELTWYVDGEQTSGEQLAQLGSAEGAYTHRFTNCGDYSVEVRFTDSDGLSNSVLWDLSVCPAEPTNKPPIATKDYPTNEPFRPEFGEKVRYGASARDPDGSIRKYEWLVDGKTVATDDRENVSGTFAISIPFTFDEQATYLVEIIFTDNNGTSSSISWTVIPDSGLPPALGDIGCSPSEVKVGQTVNCVPQLLAGAPEIIRWDAEEDGNTVKSGHDRDFSVSFDSPGEKTIAIFLSNHRGSLRVGTSITVIADGSSTPRIDDIGCSPPDPEVDDTVTCTPSLGGGAVSTYAWSAPGGDPLSGSDATFTTSWNATGDKQVSLEVCNDGECDTGEQSIAVSEAEVTSPTTTTQPTNGTTGGTPTVTTTTTQPPGGTTGGTPTTTESMPPEVSALSLLTPEELDGLEAGSAYGFAAKAIDENADIVSLRWFVYDEFLTYYNLVQFDPSSLVESALVYRIPKDGDYLIRVDFVDSKSWEGTTKWSFTAKDYAPNVDALSCTPDSPEVGDIVRCSPTLSGGTPREEFWLAFDSVRRSRSGQDYLMTWNTPGDKQVTLLVCNWSLQCGYHTQAIQVLPKSSPPIIDSVGCDQDVIHVGENLRCTPQISGGPPVEYSWTAQYGFPPTGNRESFAPDWHTRGQSTVTLKVCNRIEECDSSSQTVTVGHPIPTPVIESIGCRPLTVDIDDEVECEARLAENGQDVFYDRSEDDVLFSWSLSSDDEATYEWLDQDLSVRWYESGRERIKLKVCNIEDECDTERQTITVRRDRGSSLQINSLGCPEGKVDVDQNATCNPDVSADGRVDYYWTAYSGSPRNGRSRSFQTRWSVPGTKTINLRVCDGNECLDAERNMEVVEPATVNRPPVVTRISPGSPITVVVGGNYTFVAHATDPDGDLRSVGWQVSQRSTPATPPLASSASPTQTYDHVFDSPGHFLVSVAFYDSAGQSGRVVWEVTAVYNAIYIGAQDIHRGNLNATGDEQLLRLFVSGNRLLRLELAGPQSADLDFTVGFEGIEEDISRYWESNSSDRLQSIEIRTTSAGWYTIRIFSRSGSGSFEFRTRTDEVYLDLVVEPGVSDGFRSIGLRKIGCHDYFGVDHVPVIHEHTVLSRDEDSETLRFHYGNTMDDLYRDCMFDFKDGQRWEIYPIYIRSSLTDHWTSNWFHNATIHLAYNDLHWSATSYDLSIADGPFEHICVPTCESPYTATDMIYGVAYLVLLEDLETLFSSDASGADRGLAAGFLLSNVIPVGKLAKLKTLLNRMPEDATKSLDGFLNWIRRTNVEDDLVPYWKNLERFTTFGVLEKRLPFVDRVTISKQIKEADWNNVKDVQIFSKRAIPPEPPIPPKSPKEAWAAINQKLEEGGELADFELNLYRELRVAAAAKESGMTLPESWLKRKIERNGLTVTDLDVVAQMPDKSLVVLQYESNWYRFVSDSTDGFRKQGEQRVRMKLWQKEAKNQKAGTLVIVADGSPSFEDLLWMQGEEILFLSAAP